MEKHRFFLKVGLICIVFWIGLFKGYAQNQWDVLRYSQTDIFGSARFEAMSGSFGALGADISAIQINPASMGRFSASNFLLSFNNRYIQNESFYNGTTQNTTENKFTLNGLGVVFANDLSGKGSGKRKFGQFTIAYTRLKNFSNFQSYEGQNFYSLLDVFANDGYGIIPDDIYDARPFTTGLAYDVFALDYNASTGEYVSRLTNGDMYHKRDITSKGGMGEFHIGYSENLMNTFYYGASLGIRRVKFGQSFEHHETLLDTLGTSLRYFDYLYDLTTKGVGLNVKLGLLYLPRQDIRIGLAFESPTVLRLEDNWSANMTAMHNDGLKSVLPEYVPTGKFEYKIKTPMKLRASLAYVFLMRGAINVDVEMVRYNRGKLKPQIQDMYSGNIYYFNVENEAVESMYKTTINTRVGVEYMVFRDVFLRGGIAFLPQPYANGVADDLKMNMNYSVGLGWENNWLYVDASYRLVQLHQEYYAFDPSRIENRTIYEINAHNFVLTAGLKF